MVDDLIMLQIAKNMANLEYPAKNDILCWLVDIPIYRKRLKD